VNENLSKTAVLAWPPQQLYLNTALVGEYFDSFTQQWMDYDKCIIDDKLILALSLPSRPKENIPGVSCGWFGEATVFVAEVQLRLLLLCVNWVLAANILQPCSSTLFICLLALFFCLSFSFWVFTFVKLSFCSTESKKFIVKY